MKASIRPLFRHYLAKKFILKNIPRGERILDIGCGRGDIDFWLAKRGYQMECFEFSENAVREFLSIQKAMGLPNINLQEGDFMRAEAGEPAEAVMCYEVLEHLKDDDGAVKKMSASLKPGGYIIISVPAHMSLWDKDDEVFGHVRRYEKAELVDLVNRNGFTILQFASYGYPWLNMLKKIRELMVKIHPPKFNAPGDMNAAEIGTKHSGVGYWKSGLWALIFNSVTFYPLFLISSLFNRFDLSEGYFVVAQKQPLSENLS